MGCPQDELLIPELRGDLCVSVSAEVFRETCRSVPPVLPLGNNTSTLKGEEGWCFVLVVWEVDPSLSLFKFKILHSSSRVLLRFVRVFNQVNVFKERERKPK